MARKYDKLKEPPAWAIERSKKLSRLCSYIERQIDKGMTVKRSVDFVFRRYYRATNYRKDKSRAFRLSRKTLADFYRKYKEDKNPNIFLPRYVRRLPKLPASLLPEILTRVFEYPSFRAIHKSLIEDWRSGFALPGLGRLAALEYGSVPFSYRTLLRLVPPDFKAHAYAYRKGKKHIMAIINELETSK